MPSTPDEAAQEAARETGEAARGSVVEAAALERGAVQSLPPGALDDEAAALERGAVDSLPAGALAAKLRAARAEGRALRVKLGIDPTAPDIHLGHAVVLRKLRQFQDAGHRVVLIVGDYTARVGDPTGRSTLRPLLSAEEIEANAATFQEQALRILDPDPARLEVRRNGEWLDMPMADLLRLVRTTTVAQLLEREDFSQRFGARQPISLLELMYPVLQGYDSVAVRADVELGGTDQKFNLLLGRDVQRAYGQPEQAILTMPILVGTDGARKMSKSLGNHIGITDSPREVYGKAMSIPDAAMGEYFRLLLDREPPTAPPAELAPRDAKRELARSLVAWLCSAADAVAAEQEFDRLFVERREPAEIEDGHVSAGGEGAERSVHLPGAIADLFGLSRGEARRLIDQGAVQLGEDALAPGTYDVPADRADGEVLRVGKRRFRRLRVG
jgi:tyrosyl-tRNA synthetase